MRSVAIVLLFSLTFSLGYTDEMITAIVNEESSAGSPQDDPTLVQVAVPPTEHHNTAELEASQSAPTGVATRIGFFGLNLNTLQSIVSTVTGVLAAIGGAFVINSFMAWIAGDNYYDDRSAGKQDSIGSGIRMSFQKMAGILSSLDMTETSFRALGIQEEDCKRRAICEVHRYFHNRGVPAAILKFISSKIPGLKKYFSAAGIGLQRNDNCGSHFQGCRFSPSKRIAKSLRFIFN